MRGIRTEERDQRTLQVELQLHVQPGQHASAQTGQTQHGALEPPLQPFHRMPGVHRSFDEHRRAHARCSLMEKELKFQLDFTVMSNHKTVLLF